MVQSVPSRPAAFLFCVSRKERLIRIICWAYLQGLEANAWMEDRSRGSAAKNLSVRAIQDLPVALPPLQINKEQQNNIRSLVLML